MNPSSSKVTAEHLRRDAYLYVRQSSLHQVMENTESTKRQYGLRQQAVALGWPLERVVVIDDDLGQSASGTVHRSGFERLVAEVGTGRAGLVLGLEVSRLARSSTEWHRLLEICALSDTLILDEDGLYDPGHFNDRLLLGLKGTMSEAELHVLRARLQGGILNKARRGELRIGLPAGLIYDSTGRVVRDSDQRVSGAVRLFFETFQRLGSATAVMKHFRKKELLFPIRMRTGPHKGEVVFRPLVHSRALSILRSPRYAGAFAYGRSRARRKLNGQIRIESLPREEWKVLIPDAHEGYISWSEYEANLARLRENARAHGADRRRSPPREGPALLQGLAICGICGNRMTTGYQTRSDGTQISSYACNLRSIQYGEPVCQRLSGSGLEKAISDLLIEVMTPLSLEVALSVDEELRARSEEVDRLRSQDVEHARYEAELAERRYRRVDPDHRLVADALEADWNAKLRALAQAQEHYERQTAADCEELGEERRQSILRLATDFPRLWHDPRTPHREKKRMIRLLIDDVTLIRGDVITAHVRFKGGATRTLTLPLPLPAPDLRRTDPAVVERVDQLLDDHGEAEVVDLLNQEGLRTGTGLPFTRDRLHDLRCRNRLKSRYQRLRDRGLCTVGEMAEHLGTTATTIRRWHDAGLLTAHPCGTHPSCQRLYEPPGSNPPRPQQGKKLPRTPLPQ
ncbi:MAG: recombinase family protein [Acidobacteria bacterium]|jgi:DNA invertase Pin-like site-specific DNA recombinase|nr:recombinase family protein [Acidobacteriota bacterium]